MPPTHTPRFLFRHWHSTSGGDSYGRLNNENAITPRAFLGTQGPKSISDPRKKYLVGMARDAITPGAPFSTQGPKSIYDVSRKHLVDMANDHFNGYWVDTPFSSWTSSLAFVMSLTLMTKSQTYSCSHISILDTSKLPAGVTILFTPAMRILDKKIAHGDHEFMAFGVISGPCHTAVDVKSLRHQGIARLFDPKCNLTRNWYRLPFDSDGCFPQNTEDEVAVALQAGELFGPPFKIPFAVFARVPLSRWPS